MFTALILQYFNELVEPKIGDFTTPKPFHAVKVQGFNNDCVKLLAKFRGELPLKIFALIANFPIQTCKLSDTPPPPVRTFLFTAQCLVEGPKFVQVRFQRLGVLFFLTRAQRQICVFHTEVCPNAFTCCRQRSKICIRCYYVKPIIPAVITLNRNTTESPMPLAVFMKKCKELYQNSICVSEDSTYGKSA